MDNAANKPHLVQATSAGDGPPRPKPVFIVGFPRSGTTWMMWLLAKLPDVVAVQQSGFFHALRDVERWWDTGHLFSANGAGEGEFGRTTSVFSKADYYEVFNGVGEHVFAQLAAAGDAKIVVEQTPENLEFEASVRGVFPDAHFLHVIRDPRDASLSMRKAATAWENDFPGRAIHIANRWMEYVERAKRLKASTDKYLEVRYEDLKADGPKELTRIAEWLGLSIDNGICVDAFEACRLESMRKSSDMPAGFFGRGRSGAAKDEFSKSDLRVIEYIVGDEMERLGYERQHPRSKTKPMRLSIHEGLSKFFGKVRGRWLRISRGVRKSMTHRSEEMLYTYRKDRAK